MPNQNSNTDPIQPRTRILRIREVARLTGKSESTIYRNIAAGQFPSPVRLSARAVGWFQHDIDAWLSSLQLTHPPVVA